MTKILMFLSLLFLLLLIPCAFAFSDNFNRADNNILSFLWNETEWNGTAYIDDGSQPEISILNNREKFIITSADNARALYLRRYLNSSLINFSTEINFTFSINNLGNNRYTYFYLSNFNRSEISILLETYYTGTRFFRLNNNASYPDVYLITGIIHDKNYSVSIFDIDLSAKTYKIDILPHDAEVGAMPATGHFYSSFDGYSLDYFYLQEYSNGAIYFSTMDNYKDNLPCFTKWYVLIIVTACKMILKAV